jgi:NAD(P)-dependent dehydrogenase (short-subunit alcohol dehydrogenase family)
MVVFPRDNKVTVAGILRYNPVPVTLDSSLEELHHALKNQKWEDWEDTMRTNVSSVYFTVVAFLPLLGAAAKKGDGRGNVVITGSIGGLHNDRRVDNLHYQASKAYYIPFVKG